MVPFEKIRRITTTAGSSVATIFKVTGYLTDMKILETYTKVLSEVFTEEFPAATVVEVKAPNLNVEWNGIRPVVLIDGRCRIPAKAIRTEKLARRAELH